MIIDYLDKFKKLKPMEGFLSGKKHRQLTKLKEWLNMEAYYNSLAG